LISESDSYHNIEESEKKKMNKSNIDYVKNNVTVEIVAPFMQFCEVYFDNMLVSSYETDEYSHIDDVIEEFLIALNDLSICENKEDFAVAKATIKRLKERNFEMTYSFYSDIEDNTIQIVLEDKEIECYF
jgi:hypothetical protein